MMIVLLSLPSSGQELSNPEEYITLSKPITLTYKEKKAFKKFAEKVGIIKYSDVKEIGLRNYWYYISDNNLRYNNFKNALNKGTKMANNTFNEINKLVQRTLPQRHSMELSSGGGEQETYIREIETLFENYLEGMNVRIKIINDEEVNAFATPDGYIGINSGCINADWISIFEMYYLLGHECSHIMLAHKYVHTYYQKKQNFKMNMIAGISSAVIAAGAVYEATLGVTDTTAVKSIGEIITSANELKEDFYFKFSREEEFEADTYSMYYLMKQGLSPYYAINLLDEFAEKFGDKETEKDDSHPSNSERKKFLYYILTEYNK